MNGSSTRTDRPLYLYLLVLSNLVAVAGMTFLLIGILSALGLVTGINDTFDFFGDGFSAASTGSAVKYSYAFLAALLSFAASWKMLSEQPRAWLLGVVIVFQAATAAVFHSWVSVIAIIPLVAAAYGLVSRLLRGKVRSGRVTPAVLSGAFEAQVPAPPPPPVPEPAPEPTAQREAVARPTTAPARLCADCGATNPQTARFCGECGSILPG